MSKYLYRSPVVVAFAAALAWSVFVLPAIVLAGEQEARSGDDAIGSASITSSLVASTYFGGRGYDSRQTVMTRDSKGNLFVADWTQSPDLPVIHLCLDSSLGGAYDVFIAKFSSDLDSLLGSTYLGGSGLDGDWPVIDMAIGPNDEIYITGKTGSPDFPVSASCFQSHLAGSSDVFVSILSNDLSSVIASTYLGGSLEDRVTSLAVLNDGSVVVAGATLSADFPFTSGCFDSTFSANYDVFVTHLNASLTTVFASTLLGGAGLDHPEEIQLGSDNDLFIGGWTASSSFPVTGGAIQVAKKGTYNGFVTRMRLDLSSVIASTYLGGNSGWEFVYGLAYDSGGLFVTGHTGSATGFYVTSGAYDTSYNSTSGPDVGDDAFVCHLSDDLSTVIAGTYIGSRGWDGGWKVTSSDSLVLISGSAGDSSFPLTIGAPDHQFAGGSFRYAKEGFFAVLDRDLTHLIHSTFLGGAASDHAHDLLVVDNGDICVAGGTGSIDFPVTEHAYDTSFNGGSGEWGGDAFLTILSADYLTDRDGDAISDFVDNCPEIANPSQADGDVDGIGDVCDACMDIDNDGYGDPEFLSNTCPVDNCSTVYNPGQEDNNGDGIGNACCCISSTGNVNMSGIVDGGDLALLVAYLTNAPGQKPLLPCPAEANVNGSGIIDGGDLALLVAYLTNAPAQKPSLPVCP